MKKWMLFFILTIFCSLSFYTLADEPYRLGPKDVLRVGVWGHEDLQGEVIVLPDGTFFFPLIGQVHVAGLTITETKQRITEELAVYVKNPQVSIVVVKTRTIEVKVLGEVVRPGIYELQPGSSITDGIAMAGGPTKRAELSKVGVFAPNELEPKIVTAVGKRYHVYRNSSTNSSQLLEGDTVYVPETKAPDWLKIFAYINGLNNLDEIVNRNK